MFEWLMRLQFKLLCTIKLLQKQEVDFALNQVQKLQFLHQKLRPNFYNYRNLFFTVEQTKTFIFRVNRLIARRGTKKNSPFFLVNKS